MALVWERVYDEFGEGLRSFVLRRVGDPDAAEDIVQDVFLKVHARINTLRDEEKVGAWVYRIARNAVNDHYRATRPTADMPDLPYIPEDPAEEEVARRLAETVRRFLDALPVPDREALILTEYEGLTQVELADRLGISVSGAKSRVQRARGRLKALLLECCHFELDRLGGVINYRPRVDCCAECGRRPEGG
jgi:RNA polymerase sigma-70 factor (ECF subfamily)